jgi:hypothetical protein
MTLRPTRIIFLGLLLALALAALPGTAGAAPSFVDKQVQADILLLRGYIDSYAIKNAFAYPPATMVRKGGGLVAPIWPANPWSGRTMVPGKARGTYTYSLTSTGYRLVGHLSRGAYVVSGGLPAWLRDERNAASRSGLALIGQYADAYALADAGVCPAADQVASSGAVGLQPWIALWPQDPWLHADMIAGGGAGQYSYVLGAGGTGYTLRVHLAGAADFVLTGPR